MNISAKPPKSPKTDKNHPNQPTNRRPTPRPKNHKKLTPERGISAELEINKGILSSLVGGASKPIFARRETDLYCNSKSVYKSFNRPWEN